MIMMLVVAVLLIIMLGKENLSRQPRQTID